MANLASLPSPHNLLCLQAIIRMERPVFRVLAMSEVSRVPHVQPVDWEKDAKECAMGGEDITTYALNPQTPLTYKA